MTAAALEPTVSARCGRGEHNRCPAILPGAICDCRCGHPASRNVRAAGAVVLHARATWPDDRSIFLAEARELLAMIGVIDGDVESPEILPDDLRQNRPVKPGAPAANPDGPPLRLVEDQDDDYGQDEDAVDLVHAPRSKRVTTPLGLQTLSPATPPARRSTSTTTPASKTSAPARERTKQPSKARKTAAAAAQPSPLSPLKDSKRRGVTPASAAVTTTPPPPRELKPIPHGSLTGYTAHSRRKVPIPRDDSCGCRAARKAYDDARPPRPKPVRSSPAPKPTLLPAKRIAPVLPPIVHGTAEGWQAHHDRGALPVCEACAAAVAPPPPKPVSAAELLADAQRSPDRAVARAAAAGIRLLVQIEAAPPSRVDQLLSRLADALADVSRAQARAASRTNGATP